MKNKLSVTIGIPVYNEEANIANLLTSVLAQKEVDYKLQQLIIVCDASSDMTYKIVQSFKDKRKLHLRNPVRQGQQYSQNVILKNSKSEVTVILEGDIQLANNYTINNLVKPFTKKNSNLSMTIGRPEPVKAKGYYEKVLNAGLRLRTALFANWKNGINVYTCGGHSMKALNRDFAQKLTWPKQVPEDAFTYLTLVKLKGKIKRVPAAVAYMRNPTTLHDRIKQVDKFQRGKRVLEKYFSKEFVNQEYSIPLAIELKYAVKEFFKNPIYLGYYYLDFIFNRIVTFGKSEFNALYEPYSSSKKLT